MTMNGEAPSGADGHFRSHNERQSGDACELAQLHASEQNETTLRDLSDMQKCYDDKVGDDSDWNPISHSVRTQLHSSEQNETTLRDLSDMQECYVDEDDDDSDWDPANHSISGNERWFCTNCTGLNMDNVSHCVVCGEYKNSGILLHGCFASCIGEGAVNPADLDVTIETQEPVKCPTAIGFDERMLLHYEVDMKSHPHPERPDRVRAIAASLAFAGIFPGKCFLIPAREISEEELGLVHSVDNIEAVRCTKHLLYSYFTADTYANKYSACAARIAAGFCSDLATAVMTGKAKNGFALVRPPGHHAGVEQAMGFCLHNNAAVAAIAAQSAGAKKVLIVDWDVHHGNGTQEIFEGNKSVLYISLHRHENGSFYPGTGAADEVGIMEGEGYSVNVPWRTGGIGDNDYIFAFQNIVLPIAFEFAPDLTIISAGFDAARGDPLGGCDVTPIGYAQLTHMLCSLSQGKLLVILEGGYNLRSIASSATAVAGVLLGEVPTKKMNDVVPSESGLQTILEVLKIQSRFWPVLTSAYNQMQTKLASTIVPDRKKQAKRQRIIGPIWWKWGSKSMVYRRLYSEPRAKLNGHSRKLRRSISL